MKKSFKTITLVLLCVVLLVQVSVTALALTPSEVSSTTLRNIISNNWTYKQRGYYENNCLAWALGSSTGYYWPWGARYPTLSEVDELMEYLGFTALNANMSCDVYAYGANGYVHHFARGLGNGPLAVPIDAKWGCYEVFSHGSIYPYNSVTSGGYGGLLRAYKL